MTGRPNAHKNGHALIAPGSLVCTEETKLAFVMSDPALFVKSPLASDGMTGRVLHYFGEKIGLKNYQTFWGVWRVGMQRHHFFFTPTKIIVPFKIGTQSTICGRFFSVNRVYLCVSFLQAMNAIGEDFAFNNITISASLAFKDAALEVPEQLQELKVRKQNKTTTRNSIFFERRQLIFHSDEYS